MGDAVGVREREAGRVGSRDHERTHGGRGVVPMAEGNELRRIVIAAVRAPQRVMQLEPRRMTTPRYRAAFPMTERDVASSPRRHRLRGSRHHTRLVDPTDVLRVALRDLERDLVDNHVVGAGPPSRCVAAFANGESNLVGRAVFVATGTGQHRGRECRDDLVIVDVPTALGGHRLAHLLEQRPRGRRHLEHDLSRGLRARSVQRPRPFRAPHHHSLDLTRGAPERRVEPLPLGPFVGDPAQLPTRRPVELPGLQRVRELRQLVERLRHPQPLGRLAPGASAMALDVLGEAREAQRLVDAQAVGGDEPSAELVIHRGALAAQRADHRVDLRGIAHVGEIHA